MAKVTTKKGAENNVTIVKKLRDYSNDPVFLKRKEEAIKFLKKHGLPESITKKGITI